jgi:very-short-patch-repair endonuclease
MANQRARHLRSNATEAEKKLWLSLRHYKKRGLHFRRQVPIDGMIVDFACYAARLVIEVDGGQHNEETNAAADRERDLRLSRNRFQVLRFWNNDVLQNIEGVVSAIDAALAAPPPQTPPRKGEGN